MIPAVEAMHPSLGELYRYWEQLRSTPDTLPRYRDFDPISVPRLLSNIYLVEIVFPGPRFRFRIVGEGIVNSGGPGRRGLFVDEIPQTGAEPSLHDTLMGVFLSREPSFYKGPPTLRHHQWVAELEGIMLPMAANGVNVDHILCLTVYHRADSAVT